MTRAVSVCSRTENYRLVSVCDVETTKQFLFRSNHKYKYKRNLNTAISHEKRRSALELLCTLITRGQIIRFCGLSVHDLK